MSWPLKKKYRTLAEPGAQKNTDTNAATRMMLESVLASNPRRPVRKRLRREVKRLGVNDEASSVPRDTTVTAQ
jgi:hypothetical protein